MSILVPTAELWLPKRPAIIRPEAWWQRARAVGHSLLGPLIAPGGPRASGLVFVGGSAVAFEGTTSTTNVSLTSLTGGVASAPAEGDIVVVVYTFSSTDDTDRDVIVTGYSELCDLFANDSVEAQFGVFYKKMTATPDTVVNVGQTYSTGQDGSVAIHVWRGADQTTPIDVATTTATGINTGLANPPSVTPVTAGAVVLACGGAGASATFGTLTHSLDNVFSAVGTGQSGVSGIASYGDWTSGAYNPAAFGKSGADATVYAWAAASVVLRPAA